VLAAWPGGQYFRRGGSAGIGVPVTSLVTSQKEMPADLRADTCNDLDLLLPAEAQGSGPKNASDLQKCKLASITDCAAPGA
jgi:hypothetical protein